jgi:hypothetical protein
MITQVRVSVEARVGLGVEFHPRVGEGVDGVSHFAPHFRESIASCGKGKRRGIVSPH